MLGSSAFEGANRKTFAHSEGLRAVGSVVSSLHCMNDPQPEGHMASHIRRREFLATLGGTAARGARAAARADAAYQGHGPKEHSMTEASPVHLSRRTTFCSAAAGAALAVATFSGTSSMRAQTRSKGTFVLVHPAWFGGWCWKKVAPLLRERGYDVYSPTLTGLGERAHLARPEIGLNIHIEDVANLLKYEDLSGVVLVGNSS